MKTILSTICITFLILVGASAQSQKMKPNMPISISIAGVPADDMQKISSEYVLDENAHLRLPYLDGYVIETKGLTSTQLAAKISKAYKENKIFSSAVMTVKTHSNDEARRLAEQQRQYLIQQQRDKEKQRELEARVVYVMGAASRPGEIKYTVGMNVAQMLSKCGGAGTFAYKDRFDLLRGEKDAVTIYYKKNPKMLMLKLRPGDVIKFNESNW